MRQWLDIHQLPQSMADFLLEAGARCISDVCMLVQECPEVLEKIKTLDRVKLRKAATTAAKAQGATTDMPTNNVTLL